MKNKFTYLLLYLAIGYNGLAQELHLNLSKAGIRLFSGNVYNYGLRNTNQRLSFCIYQFDSHLKLKDSLVVALSKTTAENYLQPSSDTLHGYLNIYLQKKDKKEVTIFRFTKKFELVATVENVDVARLNNTALFSSEAFYHKNCVYTIKIQSDTSGKQFYLNKYVLRSDTKNFDYEFKWQFPFERKEIRSVHIFFADRNQVLMQVHISDGKKAGQWILKIDAQTGKLIRGTKLNAKGETNVYLFGACIADTSTGTLQLLGEKYTALQFNEKENKLNIVNRAFALVYLVDIDSLGDVSGRQDFKIPIVTAVSGGKKTNNNYVLKIAKLIKNKDNTLSFEADIYGNTNTSLCYSYLNTIQFNLLQGDENLILEKNSITSNPLVERFYFTNDKLDMNGRLCLDSVSQFEKINYKFLVLPVKQDFKLSNNNPSWLLVKSNIKKNTVNYTALQLVKKIYELTVLDEIVKDANPEMIPLSDHALLISKQVSETDYQLKLMSW